MKKSNEKVIEVCDAVRRGCVDAINTSKYIICGAGVTALIATIVKLAASKGGDNNG